jgi:hypothetical protein
LKVAIKILGGNVETWIMGSCEIDTSPVSVMHKRCCPHAYAAPSRTASLRWIAASVFLNLVNFRAGQRYAGILASGIFEVLR